MYEETRSLPIVSPHGHCSPVQLADDQWGADPALELVTRDHYLLRLMYSHGVRLEALGVEPLGGPATGVDGQQVWRELARHYHLFSGTPSKLWLDHTLATVFGVDEPLVPASADDIYGHLVSCLARTISPPSSSSASGSSSWPRRTVLSIRWLPMPVTSGSGWAGRVVPTFRPDDIVDPDRPGLRANLARLADADRDATLDLEGYLEAVRQCRRTFVAAGATASDHGHPSAATGGSLRHGMPRTCSPMVVTGHPKFPRGRNLSGPHAGRRWPP